MYRILVDMPLTNMTNITGYDYKTASTMRTGKYRELYNYSARLVKEKNEVAT